MCDKYRRRGNEEAVALMPPNELRIHVARRRHIIRLERSRSLPPAVLPRVLMEFKWGLLPARYRGLLSRSASDLE
jgi:hypothetical protein